MSKQGYFCVLIFVCALLCLLASEMSLVICLFVLALAAMEMEKVDLELKLRKERVERCLNCKSFKNCLEVIQEVEECGHFVELPLDKQVVIVDLKDYSSAMGCRKKEILCSM